MKAIMFGLALAPTLIAGFITSAQAQSSGAYEVASCRASFLRDCESGTSQETQGSVSEAPAPILAVGGASGAMVTVGTIVAWTRRRRGQSETLS